MGGPGPIGPLFPRGVVRHCSLEGRDPQYGRPPLRDRQAIVTGSTSNCGLHAARISRRPSSRAGRPLGLCRGICLNRLTSLISESSRLIDIHCHVLPQVDDGAKSWDMAQEMCRMAAADGIEHIVATPHANERYAYDREALAAALERLRQLVGPAPKLTLGCDFHLSYENLQDALVRPQWYLIEDSRCLLVELSNYSIPANIE